ncbi:MAG: zinc-ribbon domain-containing protein, partial [Alphaproteobacteria bacterium]
KMDAWYHDDERVDRPVEIAGRVNESNNFAKCYPRLAAEWHREKNARIQPYEFAADSNMCVWWKNAAGDEWQARIKDRVLSDGASGSLPRAAE